MLEVEQKYRCNDLTPVRAAAVALGAVSAGVFEQRDRYYNHPCRDFAATDEAFRIRTVGEKNFFTYKGPKLDATTKTRVEHEIPLGDGPTVAKTAEAMLAALGFRFVAEVAKRREVLRIVTPTSVELALDEVESVGSFVELEIVVDAADGAAHEVDAARQRLHALAAQLALDDVERRSYLELLLAKR